MKPLSLAIVGAGNRGFGIYAMHASRLPGEFLVSAVAEPDASRRRRFVDRYPLEKQAVFADWRELFAGPRVADAVVIATQDRYHVDPAIAALEAGYHVLLEKPIAPGIDDVRRFADAVRRSDRVVSVAHVLRYMDFFRMMKHLTESGEIGDLVSILHNENVGYRHYAHSYVRGNWRNEAESSPMILAKSCHDMDIMRWIADSPTKSVSSVGSLSHFTAANAPAGAPARCTDGCPVADDCPFYAPRTYLTENTEWPVSVISDDLSFEGRRFALETGPYGRCVYRCDNDVVDHQVASIEFENGVTGAFTMSAFTSHINRTVKLMGTRGEIHGNLAKNELELHDFRTDRVVRYDIGPARTGHAEGDANLLRNFGRVIRSGNTSANATSVEESLESHFMSFAAEESRKTGTVIGRDYFTRA